MGRFIEIERNDAHRWAEIALAVVDDHQNRGIGTILFKNLKKIAILKGITQFEAYVLSDNSRMCDIFRYCGYDYTFRRENDVFHISCKLRNETAGSWSIQQIINIRDLKESGLPIKRHIVKRKKYNRFQPSQNDISSLI